MSAELVAGQNVAWPHDGFRAVVAGRRVAMVPLGADDRVAGSGIVTWGDGEARGVLSAVPSEVQRLLLVAPDPGAVRVALFDAAGTEHAGFTPPTAAASPGSVAVLVEFYRRQGAWKVRAIGQTYAAGLADLERLHGVRLELPAPTPTPSQAGRPADPDADPDAVTPERALQLISMILEDASRSAASFASSIEYADGALEREQEQIVADPGLRVSAAGDRARAEAIGRRDALVDQAVEVHVRDLAQLRTEITEVEPKLMRSLARWEHLPDPGAPGGPGVPERDEQPVRAIRAADIRPAHLDADESGAELAAALDFHLPLVWRVPGAPLIVTTDEAGDAAATRAALMIGIRACVAMGIEDSRIVVADLGGSRGDLGMPPGLLPATVTSASELTGLLTGVVRRAELIQLALSNDAVDALPADVAVPLAVVLLDAPTAWEAETLPLLDLILAMPSGTQIVMTGPGDPPRIGSPAEDRLLHTLWTSGLRVPSGPGGHLADTYAQTAWSATPDLGPPTAEGFTRMLAGHRLRTWAPTPPG